MDSDRVANVTIEADGRAIGEIAREVLAHSGWLQGNG
jgi:hypothetical protein